MPLTSRKGLRHRAHRGLQLAIHSRHPRRLGDVRLKGRVVTICFDADARTNPNVLRAMIRLGRWLKRQGRGEGRYLIVPAEVNGKAVKGVDDFFAAGGTLEELKAARTTTRSRTPTLPRDTFTDARLAETIADDVLADQFMWVSGLGWLRWDGRRWADATDVQVIEAVPGNTSLGRFRLALEATGHAAAKEAGRGWQLHVSAADAVGVGSSARHRRAQGRRA